VNKEKVFIYGAGGHAKVVIDAITMGEQYEIAYLVDDSAGNKGRTVMGHEVLGGRDNLSELKSGTNLCVVAIGDNSIRKDVSKWLLDNDFILATVIHPTAIIAQNVTLGMGDAILAGCIISPDVKIGENVIINTGAIIEHDCTILDNVHIAPGVVICGGVTIHEDTLIGAGSSVNPGLSIGSGVIIGSGASVICDISDDQTVTGVPAKAVK